METRSVFYRVSMLLSTVTAFSITLAFFSAGRSLLDACYPLWCAASLLCLLTLSLLLRRERPLSLLLGTEIGFFLAQAALSFLLFGRWASWGGVFISMLAWAGGYLLLFSIATKPATPQMLVNHFDADVLVLVLAVLLASGGTLPVRYSAYAGAAALLSLFSLMLCRMPGAGKEGASGARALLAAGSLAIALAAGVIAWLASGGIRAGLVGLWNAFLSLLRWLAHIGGQILDWLFSLFPAGEEEAVQWMEQDSVTLGTAAEETSENGFGLIVLGILLAAAVLAALIWLFRRRGHVRFRLPQGKAAVRRSRRRRKPVLRPWLQRLKKGLLYRLRVLTRRNTAQGAYARLELAYARRRRGRKKGESCREFLLRAALDCPSAREDLQKLADALDAELYGFGGAWGKPETDALRKAMRRT